MLSLKEQFMHWFHKRLDMPRKDQEHDAALRASLDRKTAEMPSTRLIDSVEIETRWPFHLETLAQDAANRSGQYYEVYSENFTRSADDWIDGLPLRQRETARKLVTQHNDYDLENGRAGRSPDSQSRGREAFWDRLDEIGKQHIEAEHARIEAFLRPFELGPETPEQQAEREQRIRDNHSRDR